ncbi:MAG: polymerase [Hapalosiphonaceae cyanobacterium JJU2]|nr:MAG: polymerase [Hapalosiphonaceae cyanobacterium JJU2]
MTNDKEQMTKYKLPFSRHPQPKLQFSWYCAQLGLLVLPLFPLLGCVFLCVALLGTWLVKYHRIIRQPQNLGFAVLSILLVLSTVFAFDQKEAILGLWNFLPFILFFAAFSVLIETPQQLRQISWILVITSVPVVIIGLGQLFWGWTTPPPWKSIFGWAIASGGNPPGRMASSFMYANTLAGYLVIVFVLGLGLWLDAYRKLRVNYSLDFRIPVLLRLPSPTTSVVLLTFIVMIDFVGLILTNSRNAWAIAVFACLIYAIYQGWHFLVAGVTAITTSILVAAFAPPPIAQLFRKLVPAYFWARLNDQMYPDRPLALLRKTQWEFAWSLTQERPWTGWGLRNFTQLYKAEMHIWLGHPHNFFLMLSAETGLPATFLFCALLSWIFIAGMQLLLNSKALKTEDRLIFFSYQVVFGVWVLFNTADVTLFDLRLNTLSWLIIAGISGVVYRYTHYDKFIAKHT